MKLVRHFLFTVASAGLLLMVSAHFYFWHIKADWWKDPWTYLAIVAGFSTVKLLDRFADFREKKRKARRGHVTLH